MNSVPLPHKRQRQMKIAVLAYARHAAFANVSVCQTPSISPLLPWTDVADSQRHEQALTTHYHILCFCMTVEKRRQAHSNKGYQGLLLPGVLHRSRQLTETPNCTVESHMGKKVQHLNRHSFEMSRRRWLHRWMCMPGQTLYPKPWRTTFSIDDNEGWIGFSEYVSSDPPTGANCWRSKLNLYYPSMPQTPMLQTPFCRISKTGSRGSYASDHQSPPTRMDTKCIQAVWVALLLLKSPKKCGVFRSERKREINLLFK